MPCVMCLKNSSKVSFRCRVTNRFVIMVGQSFYYESAAVTPDAIDHRLGRIEDEIKTIAEALQHLTRVDERLRQHRDNIDDHEERLRTLEQVQQKSSGVVTAWERVGWIALTVGVGVLNYLA